MMNNESERGKYVPPPPSLPLPLTLTREDIIETACVDMYNILTDDIFREFFLVDPYNKLIVNPDSKLGQLVGFLSIDETRNRLVKECKLGTSETIQALENPGYSRKVEIPKIYRGL
jgi:hypothetical protein